MDNRPAYLPREREGQAGVDSEELDKGSGYAVGAIFSLGVVDLALAILVMAPLSLALRNNKAMSTTFFSLFQVCLAVGSALLLLGGLIAISA